MSKKSASPYICATCGLPVRTRTRKGVPRWTHMANAATVGRVCGQAVPMPRSLPGSHRSLVPGDTFTVFRPAGVVTIGGTRYPQRFRPSAFEDLVSTIASLKRGGVEVGTGIYTAAEVAPDGSGVTFTIEVLTPVPGREAA